VVLDISFKDLLLNFKMLTSVLRLSLISSHKN